MFVIASNITTRDPNVAYTLRQAGREGWDPGGPAASEIADMARRCAAAGAAGIEINLQQRLAQPECMEFAVKAAQTGTDRKLCLSAANPTTLEAGLKASAAPAIINYVSIDTQRLEEVLPLAAKYGAGLVLLASNAAATTDAREMLQKAAVLIGAATHAGVPAEKIYVDPGIIHVSNAAGQRHLVEVIEFLRALPEATDPPAKSTCWLGNISTGTPRRLRPVLETALLPMLAGAGLVSVFMDVLRRDNARALRLIQMFSNKRIYSDADVEA